MLKIYKESRIKKICKTDPKIDPKTYSKTDPKIDPEKLTSFTSGICHWCSVRAGITFGSQDSRLADTSPTHLRKQQLINDHHDSVIRSSEAFVLTFCYYL